MRASNRRKMPITDVGIASLTGVCVIRREGSAVTTKGLEQGRHSRVDILGMMTRDRKRRILLIRRRSLHPRQAPACELPSIHMRVIHREPTGRYMGVGREVQILSLMCVVVPLRTGIVAAPNGERVDDRSILGLRAKLLAPEIQEGCFGDSESRWGLLAFAV